MSLRPILVMAGGTGGHVYPALAVARALQANSREVVWLGTQRGLESRVIPAAGIEIERSGFSLKDMLPVTETKGSASNCTSSV